MPKPRCDYCRYVVIVCWYLMRVAGIYCSDTSVNVSAVIVYFIYCRILMLLEVLSCSGRTTNTY